MAGGESTYEEPIWNIQLKSEGHSFCKMQQKTGVDKTAIHRIVNDWNTIISVWSMWKACFRKAIQDPKQRPHGCEEVNVVAQQLWEESLWECIYWWIDGMPKWVCTLVHNNGGPT